MTQAERDYLEIVKRLVKSNRGRLDGERPLLDRHREFSGVSSEAAARIERRVLHAYQQYQARHSSPSSPDAIPASNNIPAERRSANSAPLTRSGASSNDFADEDDDPLEFTPTFMPTALPDSESPTTELPPTMIAPTAPITPPPLAVTTLSEQAQLERTLQQKQWQEADQITLELMLKITDAEAQGWLDAESMPQMLCAPLHQIDRLWRRYSNDKFGFTPQWQVFVSLDPSPKTSLQSNLQSNFQANARQQPLFSSNSPRPTELDYQRTLRFCKAVGWWQRGEFHKYYQQLAFHKYGRQPALALNRTDVPKGHLPALWYWEIPWWRALQFGGLGPSRGGCRVDEQPLVALMKRLEDCEIPPKP